MTDIYQTLYLVRVFIYVELAITTFIALIFIIKYWRGFKRVIGKFLTIINPFASYERSFSLRERIEEIESRYVSKNYSGIQDQRISDLEQKMKFVYKPVSSALGKLETYDRIVPNIKTTSETVVGGFGSKKSKGKSNRRKSVTIFKTKK